MTALHTTASTPASGARVVVAMSGGVDSSVVAALLHEAGFDAVGVSMRLYRSAQDGIAKGCCSPDDLFDARAVASGLPIPFYVINYEEEFEARVINRFVAEYQQGRTPSPCVLCNNHIKFDTLLGRALDLDAPFLATGHYARIERDAGGQYHLLRGRDVAKDQSYFLFGIAREALPRILFPLGDMTKEQVRTLAERFGLPTARKAESQDLCFVGGRGYLDFLERRMTDAMRRPGDIVDSETGQVVGTHDGVHRFTVGQRRGLGVSASDPMYVSAIDAQAGRVEVGKKASLLRASCLVNQLNWLAFERLAEPIEALAQIRYRHRPVPARIEPTGADQVRVTFATPEPAVTPGQALVVYRDDEVLGGGWIESAS